MLRGELGIDDVLVHGGTVQPNAEVTGAARLYRAASVRTAGLGSLYLLPLLVMTSNSSQAVIHVAAALSQVYEEP